MQWIRRVVFFVLLVACVAGTGSAETLVFWSSGYPLEVQDLLRSSVFPKFEAEHGVTIEYKEIGWGGPRDEQLFVALAAGVGPDVYVNGTEDWAIPLDDYVNAWDEAENIPQGFWDIARWMSRGQLLYVPQIVEIRGYAYNERLFLEAGLGTDAPGSWDEMLAYVRKLTRLDDANRRVLQSGFETDWRVPYVANEYDWFVQQAGSHLTTPDMTKSLINTPEAIAALEYMVELYLIAHPPGYEPVDRFEFHRGGVAITRGLVSTKQGVEEASPDDVKYFRLFAPRRDENTRPVAPTYVNGLSISQGSSNKDLAWEFIKYMLSVDVQEQFAEVGKIMVARQEVATNTALESTAWFAPWYQISSYAAPVGVLGNRTGLANLIRDALNQTISPGEAIVRMAEVHQVALDRLYGTE